MAKGATAKQEVENIIRNAFGKNFLGTADKKIYVLADDGGEMVNIAISLTCPKTNFSVDGGFTQTGNFGNPDNFEPAQISSEELDHVREMIKKLNI